VGVQRRTRRGPSRIFNKDEEKDIKAEFLWSAASTSTILLVRIEDWSFDDRLRKPKLYQYVEEVSSPTRGIR